jgi:hypothetical protein
MEEDETSSGTVKHVLLSGKKEEWDKWKSTVMALTLAKGWEAMLTEEDLKGELVSSREMTLDKKIIVDDKGNQTERPLTLSEKQLFTKHAEARACLLASFAHGSVNDYTHKELSRCIYAYDMWQIMIKKYEPKAVEGFQELKKQVDECMPNKSHLDGYAWVAAFMLLAK